MPRPTPRLQALTERAFLALERFLHIQAASGIVLLAVVIIALAWANSPLADSYHQLWHTELSMTLGGFSVSHSLHFWINDALMTVFFLVVGMEIRREIHEGALASVRLAALPVIAAAGGVIVPALIYALLNPQPGQISGWAVPTATDIAFAVGVLALLGRSIPGNVRIFLLALAIIDDIIAVVVIALFYSGGLDYSAFLIVGAGIAAVLVFQALGFSSAFAYVLPGALVWYGMLKTGAHPTLAGVMLGLLTPVQSKPLLDYPVSLLRQAVHRIDRHAVDGVVRDDNVGDALKQLREAQRELLPPVVRVQSALHPWVAFGIMPLFALANAGVSLGGVDWTNAAAMSVLWGALLALVVGKPVGIVVASWLAVRLGLGELPEGVTWQGVLLIGLLGGIGFTMSIFIAMLAFEQQPLIEAAKLGVLFGSVTAAVLGLAWGYWQSRKPAASA